MANSLSLVARLLKTPDLAKIIPQLPPEVLHRVIQACGLEDCAEFVALATAEQLGRILDLDIWRVRAPGADEEFDADRFGIWLAVLMQSGAAVATAKLIDLDIELVVAGFARHVAVFDQAAVSSYTTLDGEHVPGRPLNRALVSEIGGYVIEARLSSAWEAIVDLLAFMASEHADDFHRVMRGCVQLSNGPREEDGFHELLEDDEQDMFDLACDREARREQQGYVAPAQAHAFLRSGRDLQLDADRPPPSEIASAYFRTIESALATDNATRGKTGAAVPASVPDADSQHEAAAFVEVLREAGVLTAPPRALLGAAEGQTSRLSFLQAYAASRPIGAEELAYLANTIIAGCAIQGRPFTLREASDGAAAICNLGLENWPSHWSDPDLVTAFLVGWTILHRDVCMYAARHLIHVLAEIRCEDRDVDLRLEGLRRELIRCVREREPWRARHALDVIIMLDAPSWAALMALIDECPVIHAALNAWRKPARTISPTDFEFVSQNSQIAAVRDFMDSLQSVLL